MLGAFCDLYNAALQQRIEAYRRAGKALRYVDQAGELKAVRAADERLAGYSFSAEQQVLRRLDKAFVAFFGRVRTGKAGFPRFRAKSMFDSAEFRVGDGLTIRKSKRLSVVGIPGEVKVKWHRDLPAAAKVAAAVLSRAAGTWFVCFQITMPDEEAQPRDGASVGLDLGLSSLIATSDGETVAAPQWTKGAAKRQRRAYSVRLPAPSEAAGAGSRRSAGWRVTAPTPPTSAATFFISCPAPWWSTTPSSPWKI